MAKRILFTLFIILIISFSLYGCKGSSSSSSNNNSQWEIIHEFKIQHPTHYIGFYDDLYGMTVGADGEIHYTPDGGKTWPRCSNTSTCLFGLDMVNGNIIWSCGNRGNIRYSQDKGKTWNKSTGFGDIEPDQCRFVSFIDDKTGWIASPKKFITTNNSGKSWEENSLPAGMTEIAAICRMNNQIGYILDAGGSFLSTQDAGKTWTKYDMGFDELNVKDGKMVTVYSPHAAIRFSDLNHGNVALSVRDNEGWKVYVLNTSDGGKSWTHQQITLKNIYNKMLTVYLSNDAKILTLSNSDNQAVVLKNVSK
jgi:photosystem II stability/assembly factor-like uncharacterized protein